MSASEPNRPEMPSPSREELAVAPTQALRPDEPSSQLVELLDGYLAELQAGRRPNRQKLLAENPDLAKQLEQCLSGIEFIHQASVVRPASEALGQLGDFRIVREVGRGGMGVVYEAEQVTLKRRVALKVLRYGAASDSEAMQRFQREAETVATLHHTNIVPIFAIGCENGVNYYAMQFIEGRSLADVLRPSQLTRSVSEGERLTESPIQSPLERAPSLTLRVSDGHADVANWGLQAAEALAHAHHRGVIHRDIKPSNLILDPDGRIWLTDFGLAKRIDDVSLSMAGTILGTPRYMSPEQAAATKNPVDHRTDIYSLGATLYELATGRPLFEGDSPHLVITQILTTEPPAPRVICPNLPRDFETIIVKCLAKEPERRYATAQALADDLRAFVEGRAIKARRSTLAEQAARWFKQQKRSVGIAAAAVAATIFVVIGTLIAWQMHGQAKLGYLTLNTPREGDQRAEVAEVLTLDDQPIGSPFTLPTKEPLALPEGAYRLRLTAPSKVSQSYLFDVAAGTSMTHEVGLVNETVGYAISLRSPVGVEVSGTALAAGRNEMPAASAVPLKQSEPRLFVGPQDTSKPTMRCYSANSQPGWKPDGSREAEIAPLWEANWSLESQDVISFLKLPADREAWKVLPAQWDAQAWQQMLAWFDPWWFRNGSPPKSMQPARDLNGDGVEDVIWCAPQLFNPATGAIGPGPSTPNAAVLVAASGKDGKPLWWFRPQDSAGSASRLLGQPVWCGEAIVAVMRSAVTEEVWIEAVSPQTGESLWRHTSDAKGAAWLASMTIDNKPMMAAVVGDQLVVLDAATGERRMGTPARLSWDEARSRVVVEAEGTGRSAHPPKMTPTALDVRFTDLDGDAVPEVLLTVGLASQTEIKKSRLVAHSLQRNEMLWNIEATESVRFVVGQPTPPPQLLVADLNGDGKPEVIVSNEAGLSRNNWTGCRVLNGLTGQVLWSRRFPQSRIGNSPLKPVQFSVGPDVDGDGQRELFMASIRSEFGPRLAGQVASHHYEEHFLYVDCFSGRDGRSVWWQRTPLGFSEYAAWTGTIGEMLWWQRSRHAPRDEPNASLTSNEVAGLSNQSTSTVRSAHHAERDGYVRLVIPVHRHPDTQADGGTHSIYLLSAATGRVEHLGDDLAFPKLVDWNNDGLDDLAVFLPDDPQRFMTKNYFPDRPSGKFVVLRGSPPEAFRRLDRWVEEQDFDGDGFADLSQRYHGNGDYAIQIASGRDGRIMSKWKTEWPETPRSFTVGNVQSFALPMGDFDGDGLSDLLISRISQLSDFDTKSVIARGEVPLLVQAISGKTGRRIWGSGSLPLPDWIRPTDADENSQSRHVFWSGRFQPTLTEAVDLDGDGRSEVLHLFSLSNDTQTKTKTGSRESRRQLFAALLDGRDGTLRWAEPYQDQTASESWLLGGDVAPQFDASADLNGDGTRDIVLSMPQRDSQGSWSLTLQVQNGRDGKLLWGPKPLEGKSFNNNDFNPPIVSDLDGDGRAEIVLMPSKQPHVTVLRGDTGEPLWTWQGSQPQYFQTPGIAVVASRLGTPARPDTESTTEDKDRTGKSAHPTQRCVAVAFNETGSQWNLVLLDHSGKELEKVPCQSSQLWSHDLDGDGGEELLRQVDNKIAATRGLHDVLWTWSLTSQSYGWISQIERTHDGRVIVAMSSNDSVTLLDGSTGKPLGRTFKSTNTSLNENGRNVDLNRPKLNSDGESSRLLTRVGDGTMLLNHVVSRAVLPTDDDGRYQRSRHAPRDEPNEAKASANSSTVDARSTSHARSAHHAERDGYVDDPRLIRQLPWAPSPAEMVGFRIILLKQVAIAVILSLIVLLTPFWLIRAGVRRRELGRWRAALIASGVALFAICITALRERMFLTEMNGAPWGVQFIYAGGGLVILAWPTTLLRSIWLGQWRRVRWQLGGTLLASIVLAIIILATEFSNKPPEQHYSWHGWWFILLFGAFAVGVLLAAWRGFGPGMLWLWNFGRRRFARHA